METKRTELLNLIHADLLEKKSEYLNCLKVYKIKKRDCAEKAQMPTPANKKKS